jgi:hypothetical protein
MNSRSAAPFYLPARTGIQPFLFEGVGGRKKARVDGVRVLIAMEDLALLRKKM